MTYLLDVNVLIALAWPNHIQHEAVHSWFVEEGQESWATCPVTQSGFVRVSSNRRVIPDARTPREALNLLREMVALPGHVFWSDSIAIVDSKFVAPERLHGYRQLTDAHLLALALSRRGRLATFDRGVLEVLPSGFDPDASLLLLES